MYGVLRASVSPWCASLRSIGQQSLRFAVRVEIDGPAGGFAGFVGSARCLRYPGHVGYDVSKRYRGNRYAARSCKLLLPLVHAHGLRTLWITCDPKNMASRHTCEVAGAEYVETIHIPKGHEMYQEGAHYLRRYRINLRKALSNQRLQTDASRR